MKKEAFKALLKALDDLNIQQDRILRDYLKSKALHREVSLRLETPYSELRCPHCQSTELTRWGKRSDMQRYRCKKCRKTFNSLTKTPLARLRRKGHWLDYAQCIKEGLSIRKAAEVCGVHATTAFRWRHRFLKNSTDIKAEQLNGIVEVQESFFQKSEKGNRKLNRPARKRGKGERFLKTQAEKVCVFVSRDRNSNTFDVIFNDLTTQRLAKALLPHLAFDVLLCSNSRKEYYDFARENKLKIGQINILRGEYVKKRIVHLQHVNAYQTLLRDWIIGRFHGVATKYLPNYLAWIRGLDEFGDKISPMIILKRAKEGGKYKNQPLMQT